MIESHKAWDRTQVVGEGQGLSDETPRSTADEWSLYQWAGDQVADGAAASRRLPAPLGADGAHGFDGFGVSDSGGQRWAPAIGGRDEVLTEAPVFESEDEEGESVA
jgi:hypothetical protein